MNYVMIRNYDFEMDGAIVTFSTKNPDRETVLAVRNLIKLAKEQIKMNVTNKHCRRRMAEIDKYIFKLGMKPRTARNNEVMKSAKQMRIYWSYKILES